MQDEAVERLRVQVEDLRASRARLVADADAERRAFERKLHDGVQQDLVAVIVKLQLARQLCTTDLPAAGALLEEVGSEARAALAQLRQLAFELYPPLLDRGGLVVALRAAAAEAGISTHVEAEALPACTPEVAATVYFSCQEALRNAARHGGTGAKATVSVRVENDALVFEIVDNGCGFGPSQPWQGLRRISDRVAALGGKLEIESEPSRGTHVRGRLPLPA
jgi:signal transduction histidine kinase